MKPFYEQYNSYCGRNPSLEAANPKDLKIVCSEWDIGPVSERLSLEDEVVLEVTGYINHPEFNISIGPIGFTDYLIEFHNIYVFQFAGGHDIGIYFVDDTKLAKPGVLQRRKLYPACLPSILHKDRDGRGILAGWSNPYNIGQYYPENYEQNTQTVDKYRQQELILKHIGVRNATCRDPQWMNTNTFYPRGLVLFCKF